MIGHDAHNLRTSLALRMEAEHPIGAAAARDSLRPELDGAVLVLRYTPDKRYSYRLMKRLEGNLGHYCDHEIRVELVE